jgi:hypothetical protein
MSVSVLASSSHAGAPSLLGLGLMVIAMALGIWQYRWRLARQRRLLDAQAGDATSSISPRSAADQAAVDEQSNHAASQPTRRGLRGWACSAFGTLAVLLVIGLAVYGIANAGYQLWVQHSGIPAQVKILHCARHRGGGSSPKSCTAAWRQTDGTERTVTVDGPNISVPMRVDVHIRGDQAYTNGSWPWTYLLIGIALVGAFPILWLVGRRRRSRRSRALRSDDPGSPSAQIT